MATTLIGHYEAFFYSGEGSGYIKNFWCSGGGIMDRFFPSSKQHDSWSRNYRWPPRGKDAKNTNSSDLQSGCGANSSGRTPKVHSTRHARSREGITESTCEQGVTLRARDLLSGSEDVFNLHPVFPRSNPASPQSLPLTKPNAAYLSPTTYGRRRLTLGGSASELHSKSPENQVSRRSSEGNYASESSPAVRHAVPLPHPRRKAMLHPPQDNSLDTSDTSSVSSRHGTETTSADVETLSTSPTSSVSGPDVDSTSTSTSTSPLSSSSEESRLTTSTQCSYCRLFSSGNSTECCCCYICNSISCSFPANHRHPVSKPFGSAENLTSFNRHLEAETSPVRYRRLSVSNRDLSFGESSGHFRKQPGRYKHSPDKTQGPSSDSINLRVYSPNAFSYHRLGANYTRSSRPRSLANQNLGDGDTRSSRPRILANHKLGDGDNHNRARHNRKPIHQKSLNIQPETNASKSCLTIPRPHKPLTRTRPRQTTDLLPLPTSSDYQVVKSPIVALTKDASPETSETRTTTDSKLSRQKRVSKILHTKVTLVKREVTTTTSKDETSYNARNRRRSSRQKQVPTIDVDTVEVPDDSYSSSKPSFDQCLASESLGAEADVEEPTISDLSSSLVVGESLDVGQNSATDISESLVTASGEVKVSHGSNSLDADLTISLSKHDEEVDVADESKTDIGDSTCTTTKNVSKLTTDDDCSSSLCFCEKSTDIPSRSLAEDMPLSEEECSLCQKERTTGRALSPEVLILQRMDQATTDSTKNNDDIQTPPSMTFATDITEEEEEQSITSTLTSSTSALKSKTPDFLSADFPFEPEIVHKANPLVDDVEDEAISRNLGSPFRRLSEEEFVATLNIHDASGKGDLHVVKLLVKKDHKQMETVDERGWTPLHLAAARGHSEIVRYLAQEGAHLAALDPSSYTAIHLASMNGFNPCVEMLLQLGVDVDCVTAEGFTPLHLAAMNAHLESCQTLLHWGASLDKRDALGRRVQDMIDEYGLDDVAVLICRFKHQLRKFHEVLKLIPNFHSHKGGGSLMASLAQLNESEVPKEVLEMLASLAEESEHDSDWNK